MIEIRCQCGAKLSLPESALGRRGTCDGCGNAFRIAGPDARPPEQRQRPANDFAARLTVLTGPSMINEQFFIGGPGPIEIGKIASKHIVLLGEKVSRNHARLIRSPQGWTIEDQHSTNGLGVNNRRVRSHLLQQGDRVRIGDFEFRFDTPSAQPIQPTTRRLRSAGEVNDALLENEGPFEVDIPGFDPGPVNVPPTRPRGR